jgi:UDP-N-acetylmuramate--alanine ligase
MNLNQIHNVYFIGIGGIGMSALARYFKISGKRLLVTIKLLQLWQELIDNGIAIHFDDSIDLVPKDFSLKTLWLLLLLLFLAHSEWNYFMEREYNIKKRAEVLGIITKILLFCCRGNAREKTTSSILGHILWKWSRCHFFYRRYSRKL